MMRLQRLIHALAILLNAIVAIGWGAIVVLVIREGDFRFDTGVALLFMIPAASTLRRISTRILLATPVDIRDESIYGLLDDAPELLAIPG